MKTMPLREKVAQALYYDGWPDGPLFTDSDPSVRDRYRIKADAVLAALSADDLVEQRIGKLEYAIERIREHLNGGNADAALNVCDEFTRSATEEPQDG